MLILQIIVNIFRPNQLGEDEIKDAQTSGHPPNQGHAKLAAAAEASNAEGKKVQ